MKRLVYILFSLLLWTGCTDDSAVDETMSSSLPEGAIGFSTDEAVTRGTPIADADGILSMGVLCGVTDDNFTSSSTNNNYMNNVHVSRASSSVAFTYSPLQYWPADANKKLSFFAYAPYADDTNGITLTSTTTGTPALTYNVPTNVINQPDLMVAVPRKDLTAVGNISFTMKHALTCVGFNIQGYGESITKIAVKGVSVSGILSLDGTAVTWSNYGAASEVEYTSGITSSLIANNTMASAIQVNGYLMMIPQTLGENAKIVVTVDGAEKEVALTGTWTAGEQVTYNVSSSSGGGGVVIDNVTWATGNLVQDGAGCKIGAPEDGGLYFQFGSLVGWSGGANGDGIGRGTSTSNPSPTPALKVTVNNTGSGPSVNSTSWVAAAGITYWDGLSGTVPLTRIGAVGDPCRHYLGGTWRLPTQAEIKALFNGVENSTAWNSVTDWGASGTWPAGSITSYAERTVSPSLQFPASGYRYYSDGALYYVGSSGFYWSATVYFASGGYSLYFSSSHVLPSYGHNRSYGFPVRCVRE